MDAVSGVSCGRCGGVLSIYGGSGSDRRARFIRQYPSLEQETPGSYGGEMSDRVDHSAYFVECLSTVRRGVLGAGTPDSDSGDGGQPDDGGPDHAAGFLLDRHFPGGALF